MEKVTMAEKDCEDCEGAGEVECPYCGTQIKCDECGGSGTVTDDDEEDE